MSSNPKTEQSKTMDVQTAQRVEQEKMTRRAALRKLGFGAGLAAFSLLGVDDLARMVGQRMDRMAGDNKVAQQVAKEFQLAGVAFADGGSGGCPSGISGGCSGPPVTCQHCANQENLDICYCEGVYGTTGSNPNPTMFHICFNQTEANLTGCACCWCKPINNLPPANNTCPPANQQQPPQGCNC